MASLIFYLNWNAASTVHMENFGIETWFYSCWRSNWKWIENSTKTFFSNSIFDKQSHWNISFHWKYGKWIAQVDTQFEFSFAIGKHSRWISDESFCTEHSTEIEYALNSELQKSQQNLEERPPILNNEPILTKALGLFTKKKKNSNLKLYTIWFRVCVYVCVTQLSININPSFFFRNQSPLYSLLMFEFIIRFRRNEEKSNNKNPYRYYFTFESINKCFYKCNTILLNCIPFKPAKIDVSIHINNRVEKKKITTT